MQAAIQKNSLLSPVLTLSGLAVVTALAYKYKHRYSNVSSAKDNDQHDDRQIGPEVPTHLKRLLYKEQRRKESVRFFTMKKPMYDNIEMYAPTGELLCTISNKKANWYAGKNLANWKEGNRSIQLLFKPKAKSTESNTYNQTQKKNICVVCGDNKKYMRHYVVPHCYRTLFPTKYKTHMPHDIVLLCPDCHFHAESVTQRRQKDLESLVRKNPETAKPHLKNRALYNLKSVALALKNHRKQLPPHKVKSYQDQVKAHFGIHETKDLTDEVLLQATSMETNTPNPNYIPGPHLVVSQMAAKDESIKEFICGWRQHFVDTIQPRYLPHGWSVDSMVHI